jgi:hypothetical protein
MTQKKKLQVFVSSTYSDLREERQAAVEAILTAGHIPAGMELFAAGDESQMNVIRRWIDESDVYLLILGGRYGSIEHKTQKSYIQLEYEYALEKGKPLFAVVIDEKYLEKKVKKLGGVALEREHPDKLKLFRELVLSKMVRFWKDPKDIKLSIMETIAEFSERSELRGWIRPSEDFGREKPATLPSANLRIVESHKGALTRLDMLSMANKQVRILSTNLFSFFNHDYSVYEEFLKKLESGCRFQIIIYAPDSSGIREKQWEENDERLQTEIISSWQLYLCPALKKYPDNLEIKFVRINTSFAATIIDESFMFVSLNIPGGSRRMRQTPRFEIKNPHGFFTVFADAFDKIWNDSHYVTASPPKQLEKFLRNG